MYFRIGQPVPSENELAIKDHAHIISIGHAVIAPFRCPVDLKTVLYAARPHPFTEPIIIPFTKYFCRNGYTRMMGATDITMAAV